MRSRGGGVLDDPWGCLVVALGSGGGDTDDAVGTPIFRCEVVALGGGDTNAVGTPRFWCEELDEEADEEPDLLDSSSGSSLTVLSADFWCGGGLFTFL